MGLPADNPRFAQRFEMRQDQGEHVVSFSFSAQETFKEPAIIERADVFSQPPECCIYYPGGNESDAVELTSPKLSVDRKNVHVVAVKKAEREDALIVRLYESAGRRTKFRLVIGNNRASLRIDAYTLKTMKIAKVGQHFDIQETDLIENGI
jgi:alpha-mannosidase